jgi:hypothetical protein
MDERSNLVKMSKIRITIMIDEEIAKKLRLKQAKLLKKSTKSVSFSQVLNQMLRDYLK